MNMKSKRKRKQRGFTLAELLVTVAVLVILLAVGIPSVLKIQRNLRQEELDEKAETIYMAVQNKLSKMKAGGNTAIYQYSDGGTNSVFQLADIPGDADADADQIQAGDICYITSEYLDTEHAAAAVIMDSDTVEESLRNYHWVIEYNPASAVVYSVFYSEDKTNCAKGYVDNFAEYDFSLRFKENRLAGGAKVGYYGGGTASYSSTVTTMTPTLTITNAEKLQADISCTLPISISDFPVFKVELTDTAGNTYIKYYAYWQSSLEYMTRIKKEAGSWEVDSAATSMQKTGRTFTLSLTLDDLSSQATRFVNVYGENSTHSAKLKSGTPLKVTVTAMCPGNYKITQNLSDTKVTNSLFADANSKAPASDEKNPTLNQQYGTENYPAVIHYGRHLQNLEESSGVVPTVQYAQQSSDITFSDNPNQTGLNDWYETYSRGFVHGTTDGVPNFKPITNANLLVYNGASETKAYRIVNLTEQVSADAGLFEVLGKGQTIKNVVLTGTKVEAGSGKAAGALVGRINGDAVIEHCQVFLTSADIQGKSNRDVWISGSTAGGLIGVITGGTVKITGSAASTVVGAHTFNGATSEVTAFRSASVGGLVGSITGGTSAIEESYADCYLVGETAGGLAGKSTGTVTLTSSYAAGFATYQTEGAGLICGSAAMKNCYTVIHKINLSGATLPYYATAKGGSATGKVYYAAGNVNIADAVPGEAIGTLTITEMAGNLGTAFKSDTADSTAYNLMGQTLSSYTYPVLTSLTHYGDWDAAFQVGALVYYEEYSDGTYGFYGANVDSTLKNSADLTVIGDGYGVVYLQGEANLPAKVDVTVKNGTAEVGKETLTVSAGSSYTVTDAAGVRYSIYPLSKDLVNTEKAPAKYYLKAEIKADSAAQADHYYFNPHFAKTVVYLTDQEAEAPALTADSYISVRTARHLYMMSLYYDTYADVTAPVTFRQERNIGYKSYNWSRYSLKEGKVDTQAPIAGNEKAFQAVYDGQSNWITDVSFATDRGLYVGFIGRNEGTIQNVVLRAFYNEGSNTNFYAGRSGDIESNQAVYMGILAGRNEKDGRISNCAVAGYYIAGSDGTLHAYQNSYLYAGGFVGSNSGTIESCEADTPMLRLSATYANVYLGGFAGSNSGIINNSYALGHIEVAFAKGGRVSAAGFSGSNSAVIRNSYCATALSISGETTTAYGFTPSGGSVVNCKYLNRGTYSYVNHMYSFNINNGDGTEALFSELRVKAGSADAAKNSYNFNNTQTASKQYPFRAVVKDASGRLVHYGDWLDDENMGTFGIFYWELETEGTNNGYHFTYLGTANGEALGGTSLCNAHDDGGIISEYGYGYFEMNQGSVTELKLTDAVINGSSAFKSSDSDAVYNVEASNALAEQMNLTLADGTKANYTFYAFTTRTKEDAEAARSGGDNGNYLCMSGSSANSTWTLSYNLATGGSQETQTQTYTVSPFFANAMSCSGAKTITAADGSSTKYAEEPGSDSNPYEVRSIEQLQFINWRTDEKRYTDTESEQTEAKFPYECSTGTEQKHYSQTHDLKNREEANGTPKRFYPLGRAGRSFKEQYNGNSYQIKNIYIKETTSSYVGLFGELGGGTVLQNIIMSADEGKGIIDSQYQAAGYREPVVGALAGMVWVGDGQSSNIVIKNCSASGYTVKYTGTISNSGFYRYISVGGLVGSLFSGKIENCSAANTVSVEYAGELTYRQQLGGLIGTAGKTTHNTVSSTVINCYSGGKIVPDLDTTAGYLCGGLIGNANGREDNQGMAGPEETKIQNCYTYCNISESKGPQSNVEEIQGYYYIATNITNQNNVKKTYYLKYEGRDQAVTNAVGEGYTYIEMSDGTLLSSLGGTSGTGNVTTEDAGFHNVTTTEGSSDVNVDGKYSYPNRDALEGKNYPFPAIIQQKDLTFSTATNPVYVYVHYGDWPIDGPYWESGRDSMDIFQDMNTEGEYSGYATKQFILNPGGKALGELTADNFTLDNTVAKVVKIASATDGTYLVTIEAINTGTTTVKVAANGYQADFTLEITANIEMTATPESLTLSERETDRTEELVFTASSVTDVDHATAKQYGTAAATDWEVIATEGRGGILSLEQNISDKNKWIVTRLGMGKVTLKVTFTYHYPSKEAVGAVKLQKDVYIDVLQPDTVGLSDGYRYNVAYLGATATGTTTDYSFDKPSVPGRDFFLYLDSKTKALQDMTVQSVYVRCGVYDREATAVESETGPVKIYRTAETEGYYVELDKDVTVDSLYQYLAANMYYLTNGTDLESKTNVPLIIVISDGSYTYTLSINIPAVKTCKKLTVTYQDGTGHSFTKETLSGQRPLPTQAEALAAGGGFTVPDGRILTSRNFTTQM